MGVNLLDNNDGFGDGDSMDFDNDDLDFGNDDLDFGDDSAGQSFDNGTGNSDMGFDSSDDTGESYDNGFEDVTGAGNVGDGNSENDLSLRDTKKSAIIIIIIGVLLITVTIALVSHVSHKSKEKKSVAKVESSSVENNNAGNVNQNSNVNKKSASEVLGQRERANVQWKSVEDSIDFNFRYEDLTFYISDIKHYATNVEGSDSLAVKTTLTGSLSGYAGTYEIDVPYNKGIELEVGDKFDVSVQIGSYKGKEVIGEIAY